MLNKYPLWKYALIVLVLAIGFIYSAPNLYPDDPAVQISGASSALQVNQADLDRVSKALGDAKIAVKGVSLGEKGSGLIRLTNQEDQLPAKDVVRKALGDDYVVALNLAQTTPQWLRNLGASPMKLGLDLSGGVHFLLEVDMDKAMNARMKVYEGEVKTLLRKERVRYRSLPQQDGGIMLGFADDATREQARALIRKNFNDFDLTTTERNELAVLRLALTQAKVAEIREYSIKQNLTTVRNRVNELGVAEPLVQRQGANRIVVELPGVQDTAEAKRILGKTANLEFRFGAEPGASKATTEVFEFREGGRSAAVERGLIITGDQVTDAQASFDEQGRPQVNIRLDGHGGELMTRATRSNVGRSMAVIFIEQKPVTRYVKQTVDGVEKDVAVQSFQEEKKIISLATIQSPLGSQFRITGLNGQGESSELALLLRAGGLAAPMYFAEERTIGPSLGADNITKGIDASLWGMLFVSLFIIAIYRAFGVIATIALAGNMVLLLALMSLLGATLTLPGIAGIVLTMGMAVDANVLIFSRIREELNAGMSVQRAIH
ncbi:MAG: protein translocase subunit SecD, partial [Pseudomonas monteilii]